MKKGNRKSKEGAYSLWNDPIYLTGFTMFIVGNICSAIALSYAAAAVLAPLSCLNIIANVFFSAILLEESVSRNDISSTCVIMLGAGMVVYFSDHSNPQLGAAKIYALITRPVSVMYVTIVFLVVAALLVHLRAGQGTAAKRRKSLSEIRLLVPEDATIGEDVERGGRASHGSRGERAQKMLSKFIESMDVSSPFGLVVAFACLSAIFGAGSFMSAKIMSTMLTNLGNGFDTIPDAMPLLVPAMALVIMFATLQVYWMNVALNSCDCLQVVPMYYAIAILLQSLSGAVIFNEFANFKAAQSVAFAFGTMMLIFGVFRLSQGHVDKETGKVSDLDREAKKEEMRIMRRESRTGRELWGVVKAGTSAMGAVRSRLASVRRLRAASARRLTIGVV
eukprot:g3304.t1